MNNNLKINDFLVELQHVDIETILTVYLSTSIVTFFSPIVGYTISTRTIPNYKLRKESKIKDATTASLPVEVIRNFDDINKEEMLKKQFGTSIIEFFETIKESVQEKDLNILLNNFNTIITKKKKHNFLNFIFVDISAGCYYPEENTIELYENDYSTTIDHELFHVSSTVVDLDTNTIFSGFLQIIFDKNIELGRGINEGYTQYLAEKYFGNKKDIMKAYVYEKNIVEIIEKIIGIETMQSLYFSANLYGLVECLKKYSNEEEIYKFINTIDFLNKHIPDGYLDKKSDEIMISNFKYVNSFLIKAFIRKYIMESVQKQTDIKNLTEDLAPILTLIPKSVKCGNKTYDITDKNLLSETLSEFLSENELNKDNLPISK